MNQMVPGEVTPVSRGFLGRSEAKFPRQGWGWPSRVGAELGALFKSLKCCFVNTSRPKSSKIKKHIVLSRKTQAKVQMLTPRMHVFSVFFARSEVHFDVYFTIQSVDLQGFLKCV